MPAAGVRYYGGGDLGGYGQAAIATVRALVNAGVRVQWVPLRWHPEGMLPATWHNAAGEPLAPLRDGDAALADLPALIAATREPVAHRCVIVHASPESWPALFEPGQRNIGVVAWESDRLPASWEPKVALADHLVVPSTSVAEAVRRSGIPVPLSIIPHVRRHAFNEFSVGERAAVRQQLGIPAGHRVVYSIGRWDPRKALPALIAAFSRAFRASDPVSLLIKTDAEGTGEAPFHPTQATRDLATLAITRCGADPATAPAIRLVDEEIDGAQVGLLHAVGDVYATLSHGEGFALPTFDAATLGKPVVATGWGGHTDYLGEGWPGAVRWRWTAAPWWPCARPRFFPSQRWAAADLDHAALLLRAAVAGVAPWQAATAAIQQRIWQTHAEPVIARQWLTLLGEPVC